MNKSYLGIELGSTRIKAVKICADTMSPSSTGSYSWKSELKDGIWTYELSEVWTGLRAALAEIEDTDDVCAVGISGMMHGYLAFDDEWNLLAPFRTWQNTITALAAAELSELFGFNIPQRWSAAHLYQAILNGEEHIGRIAHVTTLAGYVHFMLTGVNAVGIGEASGIFPIDSKGLCYDGEMLEKFNRVLKEHGFDKNAEDVFPKILCAGELAGNLTESGSARLDGLLASGLPFAPPEGDAGTGMVATNSISYKTGNISAGTSIFTMVVLEDKLPTVHEEIDMITTPDGKPVAMVHCNNCTADTNAWVGLFKEALGLFGKEVSDSELYSRLYEISLDGDADCGGTLVCNYLSGEILTKVENGHPMVLRTPSAPLTLANFMRSHLYSSIITLKIGMEILKEEKVEITRLTGHGGFFKTKGVGQRYMAAACETDVVCLETSGEGGPYGMAVLAAYTREKEGYQSLDEFLEKRVFANAHSTVLSPNEADVKGINAYLKAYEKLISLEKRASELF